jgi:Tn3 transposase DDE domain
LTTNAVITWMTEYLSRAGDQFRQGHRVDEELLAHISLAHSENIGLFGVSTVGIDAELAQLDPTGHRPLRQLPVMATAS